MYRRTVRTEARKAANRRRLLDVARRLVSEGGFQNVQIAKVADEAGVAIGTVYRYFPSKSELCAEVFRSVCDREIEIAREVALISGTAAERLARAVRAFASRAVLGRKTAYALIAEPVDPAVDVERLVYRRALADVIVDILIEGGATDELPQQDIYVTAACIVGAVMEALVNPLAPGSKTSDESIERLLDAVTTCCLRVAGVALGPSR